MLVVEVVAATLAVPVAAIVGWLVRRVFVRLDKLEREVTVIDKYQAVQAAQLLDIKTDVHQINKKLDKIIDKLTSS